MNAEDVLIVYRADLVAAASRWQRSRSRRRRRVALLTSVLALAAVVVGASDAATGWLTGAPAPPSVKSDFDSYTPQLGFRPDPGKAVLVASDGDDQLYATTNAEGSYCIVLSTPSLRPPESMGGGYCIGRATAEQPIVAGAFPTTSDTLALAGRISVAGATAVETQLPDGTTRTIPLASSGFFLSSFAGKPCEHGSWSPRLVATSPGGNELAVSTITLEQDLPSDPPAVTHACALAYITP